jgi:hypothetical protein
VGDVSRRKIFARVLPTSDIGDNAENSTMARKYSKAASRKVARAMQERKRGTLKSGRSGAKVTSRKQAIAIGLSEARKAGKKVPKKKTRSRSR